MIRSADHSRQPKGSVHQHTTIHHQRDGGDSEMFGKADFIRTNRALTAFSALTALALALGWGGDIAAQHVAPTISIASNFQGERHEGGGDVSLSEGPGRYSQNEHTATMRTRSQNATHAAWECFY
jgi:hypothetical protein